MIIINRTASVPHRFTCAAVAMAFLMFASSPALSLTGEDVLDRMSSDHRFGYLAGTIEMAAFLSTVQGNAERGNCIMGWFFDQDGTKTIVDALSRFKDRQALPVIQALIERACGK